MLIFNKFLIIEAKNGVMGPKFEDSFFLTDNATTYIADHQAKV